MPDKVNRDIFEAYEKELERVAELIEPKIPLASEDEKLDGRQWCKENDIPESVFSDAINRHTEADWGVSPMYPWKYENDA